MSKAQIMVVEDEKIIALDIQNSLKRLGYSVAAIASSGEEAISKVGQTSPDLVLMDIKLKGDTDGVEAAQQVRDLFNIPVVYLTANADENSLQRAKLTEPYGYVLKPFEERELQTAIEIGLYKHKVERELREWVATTLRSIGDAVITTDKRGRVTFVNPVVEKLLGWKREDALGKDLTKIFSLLNGNGHAPTESPVARAVREGVPIHLVDHTLSVAGDNTKRFIDASAAPIKDNKGNISGVVLVFRDITDRKRAEEALRESEERYALAAQGANDGLWDWNLKTNAIYFSPRWKSMLGFEERDIKDRPDEWFNRVHPDDIEQLKVELHAHLEGVTSHFENEHRVLHRDGTYRWMLTRGLAVRNGNGRAYRMAGSQSDITDRKRAEEQLLHDAYHDALTDLPNRALFRDRLKQAVERARRSRNYRFAVLFLDFDRFKVINESLGHAIGDQLLVSVIPRLKICLRDADTIARLGGDEFAILLEDIKDTDNAVRVAERIQEVLTLPFSLDGHDVFTSTSIGIVLSETGYDRPEDVLRDADIAMYRAKALGKACYAVFDTGMRARAIERLALETDLRQAVERQEFTIQYQSIVALETWRIVGFEALVRWRHPKHGLIPPATFIPVAEETGLIIPIGLWVLREACRQTRAWQTRFPMDPPLSISVNLSVKQFNQPDLIQQVEQVLDETGLDASCLKLEITESVIIEDAEAATVMLSKLRALGVQVQIDDFGTGYSSLSYLHQFPIDTIKIDRSFVSRLGTDGTHSDIVETIMTLARIMAINVIAEGVETAEQLAQLRALKCDHGQGYIISEPVDREAAEALVADAAARGTPLTF